MVERTAVTFRASARLDVRRGGPVLINEACSSARAAHCVAELFGDFLDCYPGLMALVGTHNEKVAAHFPHHHPQFNIDEDALPRGAALHVVYALQSLAGVEAA